MGLVHHYDDVIPFIQAAAGLAELVNRGDDDFAGVLLQHALQFLPGVGPGHVGDVRGIESGGDLGIQINPVHHNDYCWIAKCGVHAQFLRRKHHQQRLAGTLKMPNQSLFRTALHHPLHQPVSSLVLLIAADNLDPPMLFIRREQGEVLQHIQQNLRAQHVMDGLLHLV